MQVQPCPVCFKNADVSIYVTGQKVRCKGCGNKFVVERSDGGNGAAARISLPPGERRGTPAATPVTPTPPAPALPTKPEVRRDAPRPAAQGAAPAAPAPSPRDAPTEAQPTPAAADERPVIPGYTLLKKMGEGAMGAVWKAQQDGNGEFVAIKVLVPHLAKHQDFIKRFEREARAIEVTQSPWVVQLRGRGDHKGVYYIIMEFIEGHPLRNEVTGRPMQPARAVGICRRIAKGLAAMHNAGVRHRDLKPENVLMGKNGDVKIVDFGLAGMAADVDPHPNLTRTRVTMGTMNYMAPEQKTDAKYVDYRADTYSLGVMLFEMLTGELPGVTSKFPHERGAPVPVLADDILRRALAQLPADRFTNAEEMDAELKKLENVLRNPAAAASDDASKRRWWPFA